MQRSGGTPVILNRFAAHSHRLPQLLSEAMALKKTKKLCPKKTLVALAPARNA
jgi:hypothetical protein